MSETRQAGERPRAVLLCADLLFGSKVAAALSQAGCEVVNATDAEAARTALEGATLLVADLSDESLDALALAGEIHATAGDPGGARGAMRLLGYYQHVDDQTRRLALEAGFDAVVPRSKLFREGPDLVRSLLPV